MTDLLLYRKRYIPNELVPLKDDLILLNTDSLIITKWDTLHPRKDIARGVSAYFMEDGYKISKIYDSNNKIVYWYCDIIQTQKDAQKNTVIFEDLLIDAILHEHGSLNVCALDQLADALELGLITQKEALYAIRTLDSLLKIINHGQFQKLQAVVNNAELSYSSSII